MPKTSNRSKAALRLAETMAGIVGILFFISGRGDLWGQDTFSRQSLLIPYEQRVASVDDQHGLRMANVRQEIPSGYLPWWSEYLERPLWDSSRSLTVDVEALVLGSIQHSPKVMALSAIPEIRKAEIVEAQAAFDTRAFLENKFIRTSDPVGNILTTGGAPRFRDQNWSYGGGIRKKSEYGGQFEAAQRFGYEDNNSLYYVPLPQGTAKLALTYTQPLMNGSGRAYNQSVIVLAEIDAGVASDRFAAELQNHLMEVNRAYWTLYLERVTLLEKRRLVGEAETILSELEARKKLDASNGQIVRAKAAAESRRASLIRSEAAVRNAEAKIHLLVDDPQLYLPQRAELIPIQRPNLQYPKVSVRDSLITALHNRPEINQSLEEIRAASLRQQVASKDLLPVLDAVLNMYVSGLEGQGRMGQSFIDQFSVGEPGYTAGLQFEVPLGNRTAKARLQKRQLELQQFTSQLKQTVAVVFEEIEVAVRDVDAAFHEAQAQYLAMTASDTEIKYLEERWRLLPSEEHMAGIVLEDLLAAQDRRAIAEIGFASAQVGYNVSLVNLNRATGMLVKCQANPQSVEPGWLPNDPIQAPPTIPAPGAEELPLPMPEANSQTFTPVTRLPTISADAASVIHLPSVSTGLTPTNPITERSRPLIK
jgi:outer membrane protein